MGKSAVATSLMFVSLLASACQKPAPPPPAARHAKPALPAFDAIDEALCRFARDRLGDAIVDTVYNSESLPAFLVRSYVMPSGERLRITREPADVDNFEYVGADGKSGWFDTPTEDDRWDSGNYLLPYRGRVYLAAFAGTKPIFLHMISRLDSDHRRTPVCLFKPSVTAIMSLSLGVDPTEPANWALCKAVSDEKILPVSEQRYHGPITSKDERFRTSFWSAEARVDVDFDNDGSVDHLVRADFVSTAGSGCSSSEFVPLRPSRSVEGRLALVRDARAPLDIDGVEPPGCHYMSARWLRYGGRTLLEQRSSTYRSPTDEGSEYWKVSTMEKGRARRVCEAGYVQGKPLLIARWKDGDWVPKQPPVE